MASTMIIHLASTSAIKQKAVQRAFPNATIVTHKVFLSLPPQPINAGGLYCASKRMGMFVDVDPNEFHVVIENFTVVSASQNDRNEFTDGEFGACKDICTVLIKHNGMIVRAQSFAIEVDAGIMQQVSRSAKFLDENGYFIGYSRTAGECYAAHHIGTVVATDNWMKDLKGMDRVDQIHSALAQAFTMLWAGEMDKIIPVIKDYPIPGVAFSDIFPLLSDAVSLNKLHHVLRLYALRFTAEFVMPDFVVGLESKGFLFGPMLAQMLGVGFIPVRKAGKLPNRSMIRSIKYGTEYSQDVMEFDITHVPGSLQAMDRGLNILFVDDVVATGGSCNAALELFSSAFAINSARFVFLKVIPGYENTDARKKLFSHKIDLLLECA
jgi:adenine phosphoribosyltransferase